MPPPSAEVEIDEPLVRKLLESQHPDLADGRLIHLADGWDNSNWCLTPVHDSRSGTREPASASYTVRVPRHRQAANLIESEHRWLNRVSADLPIEVPRIERRGEPTVDYPWPWSICRWLEGDVLGSDTLGADDVLRLADLLARLHRPAPPEAPPNPYRGVALGSRRSAFETNTTAATERGLLTEAQRDRALRFFGSAAATRWRGAPVWLHGDLHPRNVLMRGGRLVGLLDWGDVTSGDPASDLASQRMLTRADHHDIFWSRYRDRCGHPRDDSGIERLVHRADGWALYFGVLMLDAGTPDDPTFAAVGRRVIAELLA